MPTELLYLDDAYRRHADTVVAAVDAERHAVALEATVFFPTGGGQPNDTGELLVDGRPLAVADVAKDKQGLVWHTLPAAAPLPALGEPARAVIDWPRRHLIMRLHTAQHIMNGIIWRDHGAHVTGAQITPPEGRLDFELAAMSQEFARSLEAGINAAVQENLPVRVLWLPRAEADRDPSLIRLKANLIPRSIDSLRVIDIVGLDRQADGGTHVAATGEIGPVRVVKTESKGKANKRVRIAVDE
ncbi:MAG: alanyl-tRNA editing protein [Gaiellaceae bacterium MAG52_C11]|nr:alanyl-tRNA editing protein [Candidatus Gaiellasilicea maunaloa]